jgi:hypothetical protein
MHANNRIHPGIQSFSWSKDGSKIAVCPTTSETGYKGKLDVRCLKMGENPGPQRGIHGIADSL